MVILKEAKALSIVPQARGTSLKSALSSQLAGKLLDGGRIIKRGKRPDAVIELAEILAANAAVHDVNAHLKDPTFVTYLKKMAWPLHGAGYSGQQLGENPILAEAILDHIKAEFDLFKELGVSPYIIRTYGHSFSIFHADAVCRDVKRLFGSDPETKTLVKTAAFMVFRKAYASALDAKKAYDSHLADAKKIFGADPEAETVARTVASLLFKNMYPSALDAKKAYDSYLTDAKKIFGADSEAEPLIRTAVLGVFALHYKSVAEAKDVYDSYLAEANLLFGSDPKTKASVRTAAVYVFTGYYSSVAQAKDIYDSYLAEAKEKARKTYLNGTPLPIIEGHDINTVLESFKSFIEALGCHLLKGNWRNDVMQSAYLVLLELFAEGERDAAKITDTIIARVTKEASVFVDSNKLNFMPMYDW